ncbi:MAG: hypothetical protein AAB443_00525 [Patescibacteria group bacterium]
MYSFIKKYELSGGSVVWVVRPFGLSKYFAIVRMTGGKYPEEVKMAKDVGRKESCLVLSGQFEFVINTLGRIVGPLGFCVIRDGDTYKISGRGWVLVLVEDEKDGKTLILKETQT